MHAGVEKVWSLSVVSCRQRAHEVQTCVSHLLWRRRKRTWSLAGKLGCKITRFEFLRFPDGRAEDTEVIKVNLLCIKVEPGVTCSHEMTYKKNREGKAIRDESPETSSL